MVKAKRLDAVKVYHRKVVEIVKGIAMSQNIPPLHVSVANIYYQEVGNKILAKLKELSK